jgi:glutathione S-transferase
MSRRHAIEVHKHRGAEPWRNRNAQSALEYRGVPHPTLPNGQAVITLHHLNNSRSQRIIWLLEELDLAYDIKRYQRDANTMLAPPSLRKVHPLGRSPVITDGDHTLAESGAIIEYLVERYGAGRLIPPAGSPERLRYSYWLHFAEGSAMPPLLLKLVFDKIETTPMPFFAKPVAKGISAKVKSSFIDPQITQNLDYMEKELAQKDWFAGTAFSAADIQMSFPLEAAAARGGLDESRPRLMDFLQRIHARPAYQRALARGGDYSMGA